MRISDWSSDVCSSDLARQDDAEHRPHESLKKREEARDGVLRRHIIARIENDERADAEDKLGEEPGETIEPKGEVEPEHRQPRSEEHTSELQSLMRISYAVFCLNKQNKTTQ